MIDAQDNICLVSTKRNSLKFILYFLIYFYTSHFRIAQFYLRNKVSYQTLLLNVWPTLYIYSNCGPKINENSLNYNLLPKKI